MRANPLINVVVDVRTLICFRKPRDSATNSMTACAAAPLILYI
ncbi:MAG: hypothetical protein JWM99_1046 [Verrucomicrobiales bacterium]|nr:hypothetical protein [Verrucomicrobiales bacterium]